jgi:hypothetical protein
MLVQLIHKDYTNRNAVLHDHPSYKFLSTDVSYRFLVRKLEVASLNDIAVRSGQHTERKTKNLGNIGLDIETDLREFDKENSSRRISEGLRATALEQQPETLARKCKVNE